MHPCIKHKRGKERSIQQVASFGDMIRHKGLLPHFEEVELSLRMAGLSANPGMEYGHPMFLGQLLYSQAE